MTRICHYIRKNHRTETPTNAVFVAMRLIENKEKDFEETYSLHSYVSIHARYHERTGEWTQEMGYGENGSELIEQVSRWTRSKTRTYLICHNSNNFLSLCHVLDNWPDIGWKIKTAILNCPPCIVSLKNCSKNVTVLDMQNIWQTPLSNTLLGETTQDSADETEGHGLLQNVLQLLERAKQMCKKWLDWWHFLKKNDLGGFSPTIGSQSFRVWRHCFMTHQVVIDTHEEALKLARESLYGGRCECFHIGKFSGQFYQLDVNACYPAIMSAYGMPTRIRFWTKHGNIDDLRTYSKSFCCIARVTIRTDTGRFPYRSSQMLVFPRGQFTTVLAGSELRAAVDSESIVSVEELCIYHEEPAFAKYMNALWQMRQECKNVGAYDEEEKWKLLSNAFAGKWGQKGGNWETYEDTPDKTFRSWVELDMESGEQTHYRQFGGLIQVRSHEAEGQESSPAILACITAQARTNLWSYITTAGLENTYYVDTDSILVNDVGYRRLREFIKPGEMGMLKVVGTYDTVQIYNAKHYKVGNSEKHAGRPANAVANGQGAMDFVAQSRVSNQIRTNQSIRAVGYRVCKSWKDKYKKGVVLEDGRVEPLEV